MYTKEVNAMSNESIKQLFAKNLKNIMNEKGKTQSDIVKDLQFRQATVSDWINGKKYPRMNKVEMLAKYFDVPITALVDKHDNNDLPELTAKDEREIESDLEDMMHSVASAACEGDDDFEDIEAFKATIKAAMIQAKRIAKKKYTPKKYRK